MSHFTVAADTDDNAYGQSSCRTLADTNPGAAINNADNHEYMAENTPQLACNVLPPSPTNPPTPGPTNQTPAPTPEPTCGAGLKKLQVDVLTDDFSEETSWVLVDTCTNQVQDSKNSFTDNTQYSNNWCLPEAQYEFTINDSFGDGICCGFGLGSYSVTWDGSVLVDAGGNFASSETTTFGSCSTPPPTPPPTPSPTTPNPTANVSILTCLDTHDMFPFVYTVVSYLRFVYHVFHSHIF